MLGFSTQFTIYDCIYPTRRQLCLVSAAALDTLVEPILNRLGSFIGLESIIKLHIVTLSSNTTSNHVFFIPYVPSYILYLGSLLRKYFLLFSFVYLKSPLFITSPFFWVNEGVLLLVHIHSITHTNALTVAEEYYWY